ncbi:MAG: NAD(+) diphosphatase [Burkholderiales bacterium]
MFTPAGFEPGHALAVDPGADAYAFAFRGDRVLVHAPGEDALAIASLRDIENAGVQGTRHFLGMLDGRACLAIDASDDAPEPAGMRYLGLRSLFFKVPEELLAIAGRAFQVVDFDRTHRFCGRCGTPTRTRANERAKECPACALTVYPRVSPAMMVLVTRGKELLLARASRFTTGMFSALAGFVEPGETIEDCVRREVREEVGVEVDNITYFASQSWAFPHSLMIAYTATWAGGDIRIDDAEIAEARWFHVDELPKLPMSVSIARRLIDATAARLRSA